MDTKTKLIAMNTVLLLGAIAIVAFAFPRMMQPISYGGPYAEGPIATLFLALVQTGIPTLMWLAGGHVLLAHVLFAEGEISDYKARRRVETTTKGLGSSEELPPKDKREENRNFDD